MSLTQEEIKIAADCADNWEAGNGTGFWFKHKKVRDINQITEMPCLDLKDG